MRSDHMLKSLDDIIGKMEKHPASMGGGETHIIIRSGAPGASMAGDPAADPGADPGLDGIAPSDPMGMPEEDPQEMPSSLGAEENPMTMMETPEEKHAKQMKMLHSKKRY